MKPVLFTSNKPLERAENINAVISAFDGDKVFIHTNPWKPNPDLGSNRFSVRVCDEFIGASPGKAIMIGHGVAGGKTYGLDQPHPYHRRENAKLLTYVVTTSTDMIPLVAKQSGVPEDRVLALGMPRTDKYFGVRKGDGRTGVGNKRLYLFAPTFRAKEDPPYPVIDYDWIDENLTDGEIFAVKAHMVTKKLLKKRYRHIVELSAGEPSAPYLIDCDVLITDYSSILFDAHILGKSVVLFEKNKGYLESRGMYLPYPHGYASRYCENEADLIEAIRDDSGPRREDLECLRLTASACDGHSTERVCDLIRSIA